MFTFKGSTSGLPIQEPITKPKLVSDHLFIRITASGLCGTDVHYKHAQNHCLGHEGCGIVEDIGPSVTHFKVGDRVGFGYLQDSCGFCEQCLTGNEIFCEKRVTYDNAPESKGGSLASHVVWRESYAFRIPEGMADEEAAPLMCGGATVFTALTMYDVRPTERVGIIGIGGLGHLAIQFAAKMGCEVTVFSGTDSKKEDALQLGAKHFIATKGVSKLDLEGRKLNRLIVSTSAQPDWKLYMPIMAPGGIIIPLSVSKGNLAIPYTPLLLKGLRIQGSVVASRQRQREMIEFAARHGIKPVLTKFPLTLDGLKSAFEALDDGSMRYRGVLIAAKI